MNARSAKAALAAAHTGVAAPLDGIDGGGDDGAVQRLHDLALRHRFAPADDPPVQRVFPDERRFFLGRKMPEHRSGAGIGKMLLCFGDKAAAAQQLHRALGNGRRGGKTGGADPRQIDKARRLLRFFDNKVFPLGIAPHTGKVPDGFPVVDRRNAAGRGGADFLQSYGGVGDILHLGHRVGARPHDQVAVNGRRDKNALALLVGALKNDMVNQSALRFIHNVIFPADAPHGKAVSAHHLMHLITVQAGGIYNVACFKIAFGGMQAVAVLQPVNAGHRGGEVKVAAVYHCRFRQRQRIFPWTDNRGGGRIKGAGHRFADIRLQRAGLIGGQQFQLRHAVGKTLPVQHFQVPVILFAERQYQRADFLPLYIQLFAQLPRQRHAAHVQFRHQGTGERVISGVQDGAVGFCRHIGNIVFGFQNQHLTAVAAQLIGGGGANDSTADHSNIIHGSILLIMRIKERGTAPGFSNTVYSIGNC